MGRHAHVETECDLHGLTRAEALAVLEETVDLLRRRGGGRVRIIHGCGEVLSEMVYDFARRTVGVEAAQERDNAGAAILLVRAGGVMKRAATASEGLSQRPRRWPARRTRS